MYKTIESNQENGIHSSINGLKITTFIYLHTLFTRNYQISNMLQILMQYFRLESKCIHIHFENMDISM